MRPPHARPIERPRFVPCGRPDCAICRHNVEGEPPDSGHPDESLVSLLVGIAAIVVLFAVLFIILPVLR